MMASADRFAIHIQGKGGHGAAPHLCNDPLIAGAALAQAMQTIVSRNVDPLENAVVSVTTFNSGDTDNVIPDTAKITGTVRTYLPAIQDMIERRIGEICQGIAGAYNVTIDYKFNRGYPATINHKEQTDFAIAVARDVVGHDKVNDNIPPVMGAEDFSFMLNERPGCYIFMGNGNTPYVHHPAYYFDDNAIPFGSSYWAKIIEKRMPA